MISMSEFKFVVTNVELTKHLKTRVEHHQGRAKFYVDKAAGLRETTEKYVASKDGNVTLPEEILERISVEPNYSQFVGGMGNWAPPRAVGGMRARALGVKRNVENAQDAVKAQVVEQLEQLTMQHEQIGKVHETRAEELGFYLGHLPGVTQHELSFADLTTFELVKQAGPGGYLASMGAVMAPRQLLNDEESFG